MTTIVRNIWVAIALAAAVPTPAAIFPTAFVQAAETEGNIDQFTFCPQRITVKAGTTVIVDQRGRRSAHGRLEHQVLQVEGARYGVWDYPMKSTIRLLLSKGANVTNVERIIDEAIQAQAGNPEKWQSVLCCEIGDQSPRASSRDALGGVRDGGASSCDLGQSDLKSPRTPETWE